MVKKCAVPRLDGMDFYAEFRRQEVDELEGFSFDEKTTASKRDKKRKAQRKEQRAMKRAVAPIPIPPPVVINIGRTASTRSISR